MEKYLHFSNWIDYLVYCLLHRFQKACSMYVLQSLKPDNSNLRLDQNYSVKFDYFPY